MGEDNITRLSIIIPHYEKQRTLKQVYDELILQIDPSEEIIVVDDHSPHGTPDLECDCTRVIQPPKHSPHTYRLNTLRNYGLQHATHDHCIILDPDCVPNPKFLANARKMCDANVLHGGKIDKIQGDGTVKRDTRGSGGRSCWVDLLDKRGGAIWGGVMMFSKSRAGLVGWFDEDYDGAWGAEDADFAAKCYHSGMRLRYSVELGVTHQYHPKNEAGYDRNRKMWLDKTNTYMTNLNVITPYKPAVGVMVITMLRPELIDQCMQAIFRNRIALKARLIRNGEDSVGTRKKCEEWGRRWAVDYVSHPQRWPAVIRNESLQWAEKNKFKYLVFIDDDVTVVNDGITRLASLMEANPKIFAMSGKLKFANRQPYLLGGPLKDNTFYQYTERAGLHPSDWVGGGFTIHRVNPLLLYDDGYETGFNDYDWSMEAKKRGYHLAVTGDAEAWHGAVITSKGVTPHLNRDEYNKIRYDSERHNRMRKRFERKWGFWLQGGKKYNE